GPSRRAAGGLHARWPRLGRGRTRRGRHLLLHPPRTREPHPARPTRLGGGASRQAAVTTCPAAWAPRGGGWSRPHPPLARHRSLGAPQRRSATSPPVVVP